MIITDKISTRLITAMEQLEIEKIAIIPIFRDIGKKSKEFLEKKGKEYAAKIQEINEKIKKLSLLLQKKQKYISPLDRLRKQGKFLILFHLRDGNKIAGSIIRQNKDIIQLDTGAGIVKIKKDDIIRRNLIK